MKLSYSTNGLVNLDILTAISVVKDAGYDGVELAFDVKQFNPLTLTHSQLIEIKQCLAKKRISPACIQTASMPFLKDRPHEPSIICLDKAGRKQRIHMIKKGIEIAKFLHSPIVTFGSGFIRDEHILNRDINPQEILIEGIEECMKDLGGEITLVIEPEPGMYIETLDQALSLIKSVNSDYFKLHIDLCHLYCSENDYISSLREAIPYTRYLHISDTSQGCNVKLYTYTPHLKFDFLFSNYLIYFPETCDFLFLTKGESIYFYSGEFDKVVNERAKKLIDQKAVHYVNYDTLDFKISSLEKEINTYIVSVSELSFCVLDRAKPILHYLRTHPYHKNGTNILDKKIANTLTGKVHYHDIPGVGEIDFTKCFQILTENNFDGYATVELYHHINTWESALKQSIKSLKNYLNAGIIEGN